MGFAKGLCSYHMQMNGIAKSRTEILKDGYPVSLGVRENMLIEENESRLCGNGFCKPLMKAIVN